MVADFIPLTPETLLALPPLVGVTDFEIGVVGFSLSIFFVEGVLALDEVPLLGLKIKFFFNVCVCFKNIIIEY